MKSAIIEGSKVKLYPYIRGVSNPNTLLYLWTLMRKTPKATERLFWSQKADNPKMVGDLESFVIASLHRTVLSVFDRDNVLNGMVFFEDIIPQDRANIGLFYNRKLWGHAGREATVLATRWAFQIFDLQAIWGITPHILAKRHVEPLGWKHEATLMRWRNGHNVYIMKKERD